MYWKRKEPVYMQVVNEMKNSISAQYWAPGTLLPNEFELARQYGISRTTLRNAMTLLEKEGYIIRRKFSGTIVAPEALQQKYNKLDIGFVSRMHLKSTENANKWFNDPYQFGSALLYAMGKGHYIRFIPWQFGTGKNPYELDELVFKKAVDAFIVDSPLYVKDFLDVMAENRIPHVALESHYERNGVNTVMFDDRQGVMDSVKILHEAGHRKIGLMGGLLKSQELSSMNRRIHSAFIEAGRLYGLNISPHWIQVFGENEIGNISFDKAQLVHRLLGNAKDRPTALVCSPGLVDATLAYCEEHNISVPKELSIICQTVFNKESLQYSGLFADLEESNKKVYEELFNWLRDLSYRPRIHYCRKTLINNFTISTKH